jgi:DNA-binding beta-propeller fold protein YncE
MLSDPQGISVDQLGRVYVADTGNDRIQAFDPDGRIVGEIGGFGWDQEQFNQPVDVCARTGMNIYVADSENRRIQRLDRRLNFIETISEFQGLEFSRLGSLDVSSAGDLFVVDEDNREVILIDPFSREGRTFGGMGYGAGSLVNPSGLAVDGERRVLVADSEARRILEFDSFGNFVASFGEGTLIEPTGCTVDADGNLFVADVHLSQIVVFDRRGQFVQRFGAHGRGPGSFDQPMDLAFDPKGRLYVLDSGNNRIQVFEVMKNTEER